LGFGWRAVIIGEVLAQPIHGIGTAMKDAQAFINVSELIAWTIIAILLSYVFDLILKFVRKINFKKSLHNQDISEYTISTQNAYKKEIKAININKRFNEKILLNSFNHEFNSEFISCLKSPSGKGKTTLLRILSGLDSDYSGKILLQADFKIGYAFQDFRLLPWLTVSENIRYSIDKKNHSSAKSQHLICYLLQKMELLNEANNYPSELSGGQQQRVSLARALAAEPDILLLDEPLSGLDEALKTKIVNFLAEWLSATKPIVIWATHENIKLKGNTVEELFI
ncbi:MAG: ATP-binding cassette domain-containing protein, partial [Paludibacter sp.]|nr:ATP-binding cassette domain-containing protein [Paludibacter sp.]